MEIIFIRTIILFIVSIVIIRLMGKRQLGQLEPYEVVVTIMIAELALTPMNDISISLFFGIVPIVTLFIMHTLISYLCLKLVWFRELICGKNLVIIEDGCLLMDNMKKTFLSLDELLEALRKKDVFNVDEVQYAMLESDGSISVMKKDCYNTPTLQDLNIKSNTKQHLPIVAIVCGKIQRDSRIDIDKLTKLLVSLGFNSPQDVFYASISSDDILFVQGFNTPSKTYVIGEKECIVKLAQ